MAKLALLLVVLAGCAVGPTQETPLQLDPLEMEHADGTDPGCRATQAYREWASEGIVVRLEPGCGLVFTGVDLHAARPSAIQVGQGGPATVVVLIDGAVAGRASGGPGLLPLAGDWRDPGRYDVRIEHDASVPLEVDALFFERRPSGMTTTGVASTATSPVRQPIDPSDPIPFEMEDFDEPDFGCAPAASGPTETVAAAWARGGQAVRLPEPGCGVAFRNVFLPAAGHFASFQAQFPGTNATALLRVLVDGTVVATAVLDAGAPAAASLQGAEVAAGYRDVRVDVRLVHGDWQPALVDYVDFQT